MNGLSGARRRAPESFSYDIPREDADSEFRVDLSLEDDQHVGGSFQSAPHTATTSLGDSVEMFAPVDNLSSNKDQTMFVAAGSFGVIKIFRMESRYSMYQVADLRALKQKKLAYTASAVVWSKVAENLIATVSTNGTVVLWDPSVPAVLQETRGHSRSATSVDFHRSNPFLLVSSSKGELMMHDTRTIEAPKKFKINNDTIRDVSFCLHQPHHDYFVAADETGAVKFWDMRKEDKPYITFQPHHGLASSVALHPINPSLIASGGGRDKLIKIWDWRLPKNWERKHFKPIHQVETIAPVSRVYWRPDKEHEIASCAVVSDTSVAVWDVRRPFLPVTSYRGHRDSATDIWWNHNDPSYFVSAGKDGVIRLHRIEEGEHTVDHLCDCTMDIAPDGMMAVAVSTQIGMKKMPKRKPERKTGANLQFTQRPGNLRALSDHQKGQTGRRPRTVHFEYDPFKDLVPSRIATGIPCSVRRTAQPKDFARLASDYLVGGKSMQELCEWNARVAAGYGFPDKAESWRVLAVLIESAGLKEAYQEEEDNEEARKNIMREKYRDIMMMETDETKKMLKVAPVPQPKNAEHTLFNINKHLEWNPIIFSSLPFEQSEMEESMYPPDYIENSDFYFGPGELRGTAVGLRNEEPPCDDFLGLEAEAFSLRPSEQSAKYRDLVNSTSGVFEFDPLKKIKTILMRYAEQGDVQMCTVAAAIIGSHLAKQISFLKIELWARSYFDMLERLELHVACTQLCKYAWMKGMKERGHQSTFLPINYQHLRAVPSDSDATNTIEVDGKRRKHCKGHIEKGRCSKCRDPVVPICVACDRPIIGLLWSCVKCSHSMHVQHALSHFKNISDSESDDESQEDKLLSKARKMAKVASKCPVSWCRCNCNVRIRSMDDAVIPSRMTSIPLGKEGILRLKQNAKARALLHAENEENHKVHQQESKPAGMELYLDPNQLNLRKEDHELLESLENRCKIAYETDDPYKEQIRSLANVVYALHVTTPEKVQQCAEYLRSVRDSAIEAKCLIYQEIVDITDPRYSAMDRIADYNETCVIDDDAEVGRVSDDDRSSMASECEPEPGISLSPSGRDEDIRDSITSVTITSGVPSSSNTELIDEEPIVSDHAYIPRRAVAIEEMINDAAFKFMYGEEYQVALNAILRPTKTNDSLTPLESRDRDVVLRAFEGPPEEEDEQLEVFQKFHNRMMDKQSRSTCIRIERLLDPELSAKPLHRPAPPQRLPIVHDVVDSDSDRGSTEERRSPSLRTGPIPFYPVTRAPDTNCETKIVNDCGRVHICLPAIPTEEKENDEDSLWRWGQLGEDPVIAKNLELVVQEVNRAMFAMEMEVTHHAPASSELPPGLSIKPIYSSTSESTEQSAARIRYFDNLESSIESDPIALLMHDGRRVPLKNTPEREFSRYY